jgi:ABC-type lipoprotein release transport system permease subunit
MHVANARWVLRSVMTGVLLKQASAASANNLSSVEIVGSAVGVGTTVMVVTVVCTVMAGVITTGSATGLLEVHPAMRRRNTRAAIARTGVVLFVTFFFMIIPS